MSGGINTDALSLTLPKASRSRVRIRRPKKPSKWQVFIACCCLWIALSAVVNFLGHDYVTSTVYVVLCGITWKRFWAGGPGDPRQHRLSFVWRAVYLPWVIWLIAK